MRRLAPLLLLFSLLLTARLVHAENTAAKERTARTACLSGDYAKGVQLLSELFVSTMDPTFIYNQGRCFEQNRRYEDAIARFQEYLRAGKKLSKADRTDTEKHIDDCEALLAKERSAAVPSVVPSPAPAPAAEQVAVPGPAVAPTPAVVQHPTPAPTSESGASLRTAGIIAAAVGGAALVTGVVLNLKVNGMASDLQKTDGYSDGKESDRKTYQTLGWVSYGVGAACVATGAVLYFLGQRSAAADSTSVALVPSFAPGQAGAVLKGAF
jgi:hypothetical protein